MLPLFRAHRLPVALLLTALMAFWQIGQPLQAATFYWDTDTNTTGNDINGTGLGGTGNWDLATSNWWNLASLGVWPNTNADVAVFSSPYSGGAPTPFTVTLSSGIVANQLQFHRSGYTLTGGISPWPGPRLRCMPTWEKQQSSAARFSAQRDW